MEFGVIVAEVYTVIYYKTLANIRKNLGYSQEDFAKLIGCSTDKIIALECNEEQATYDIVDAIRAKFNLKNAPITETERNLLLNSLFYFKSAIDYGDYKKAAELKPGLEKSVKSSYSPSTEIFYDLFATAYYWQTHNTKAYEENMTALNRRKSEFSARHHFYYYRLIAAREFAAYRYDKALESYIAAEKLDKDTKWGDVGFYYGLGRCLSDMGFAKRASVYFRKAKHLSKWQKIYEDRPNRFYDAELDGYLAYNLSKIGESNEALEILYKRLEKEIGRVNANNEDIGFVYLTFGRVYRNTKDYDTALYNFDEALQYLSEESESYKVNLYHKALTLIDSSNISEGLLCVDKGLRMPLNDTNKVLFEALKCSVLLSDSESLEYMERTIMPKLLEYKLYEEAVKYSKVLSDFCAENGDYESALEYSNTALEIKEQLYEERVEGGL